MEAGKQTVKKNLRKYQRVVIDKHISGRTEYEKSSFFQSVMAHTPGQWSKQYIQYDLLKAQICSIYFDLIMILGDVA